jgi:molecular chaperone GrpE (heat shock protein)
MTALASMDDVRRRMLSLLKKNGVEKITFPDGKPKAGFCAVTSEEIDPTRENGDIVSIERDGYTRDGQLLRRAEIVVVKNK